MQNLLKHLSDRGLDHRKESLWLDEEAGLVTFPLWNLAGQLVGYQQYNPFSDKKQSNNPKECRYYTYVPTHVITAYGLEKLNYDDPLLFVVEGVFDAVRFHNMGLNCLAVLSCDPKHLKEWLRTLPFYKVVICDGDKAGLKLAKYGDHYFNCREGHDPASDSEFLLRTFRRVAQHKLRKLHKNVKKLL